MGSLPWSLRWTEERKRSSLRVLSHLFGGPSGPGFVHRSSAQTSYDWAIAHCCSGEEEPTFPDGCFDSIDFCLVEGLGAREVGVVGTTLEAKDSPEDFGVRLSELVLVGRIEGPRHTPVQQGLNHLGVQPADLQAEPGGRRIVSLGTELFVACSHGSDPPLDLDHEVIFFVNTAPEVYMFIYAPVPPLRIRTVGPVLAVAWSPSYFPKP